MTGYALPLTSLILLGGALGDRYGQRRIFGADVALFTAGSLGCALAPAIEALLAAQATQGVGEPCSHDKPRPVAVDVKLACSLSLLVSLPTMLVAFFRYSRDEAFAVLASNRGSVPRWRQGQ